MKSLLLQKDYEYLLGVYLGDGGKYNKYGIRITVSQHDADYMEVIKKIMLPLKPDVKLETGESFGKPSSFYRIRAGLMANPCNELFHPYKKKGEWVNIPELKYPQDFIAGIFDTDGSIRKRKWTKKDTYEIMIYQKRRENLELLTQLLEPLFIYPALRRVGRKTDPMHYLDITHPTQMKIFALQIPSRHPRKNALLSKCERYSPTQSARIGTEQK